MGDITFGPTPTGQLLYDLGFAKLTDKWIARKHRLPVAAVRRMRKTVRAALKSKKRRKSRSHP